MKSARTGNSEKDQPKIGKDGNRMPPSGGAETRQAIFATEFRKFYDRGDFPIQIYQEPLIIPIKTALSVSLPVFSNFPDEFKSASMKRY